ncbi:SlyX family protein [Azotobacter beijerinckii]|nr:SlyX family protein [Azotobacter beijerinckii]MDV7210492.1 SlyX family protein [Azotobacter beijerinckii]
MNMNLETRINDLETRLAFQDDTIQALNDVLVAQQRVVERLQLQLEALAKRQEELLGELGSVDDDEAPPPHY